MDVHDSQISTDSLSQSNSAETSFPRGRSPREWGLDQPLYRRLEAFKLINVGSSKGHQLINAGELEVVMVGHSTNISAISIANVLNKGLRISQAA